MSETNHANELSIKEGLPFDFGFPSTEFDEWVRAVEEQLGSKSFAETLVSKTRDNLEILPLYTATNAGVEVLGDQEGGDVQPLHPFGNSDTSLEELSDQVGDDVQSLPPFGSSDTSLEELSDQADGEAGGGSGLKGLGGWPDGGWDSRGLTLAADRLGPELGGRPNGGWDVRQQCKLGGGEESIVTEIDGGATSVELIYEGGEWNAQVVRSIVVGMLAKAGLALAPHADISVASTLADLISTQSEGFGKSHWLGLDPIGEILRAGMAPNCAPMERAPSPKEGVPSSMEGASALWEGAPSSKASAVGEREKGLAGSGVNEASHHLSAVNESESRSSPPIEAMGEIAELVKMVKPSNRVLTVDAAVCAQAGATEAQELAYSIACGVEYLRQLEAVGVGPEVGAMSMAFRYSVTADQFVNVAKLRAARLLWRRITLECGVRGAPQVQQAITPPTSHPAPSHPTPSPRDRGGSRTSGGGGGRGPAALPPVPSRSNASMTSGGDGGERGKLESGFEMAGGGGGTGEESNIARLVEMTGGDGGRGGKLESGFEMAGGGGEGDWSEEVLRGTVAAFSAAVGGADVITVLPCGESGAMSGELARRLARNTQLLLLHEAHLGRVIDPATGSWFLESLTQRLAARAWEEFVAIEVAGGVRQFIASGSFNSWRRVGAQP